MFNLKKMQQSYPFYRKYPNGYLNYLGSYNLNELEENGILRKFEIIKATKRIGNHYWKKSVIIVMPKKENPKWREQFRLINKPLSFNYIY